MTSQTTQQTLQDSRSSVLPNTEGAKTHSPDHGSATLDSIPLIPRAGVFEGMVAVVGETRIEGTVRGNLRGPGSLVLGPEGRVEGAIECDAVTSQGVIIGPVAVRTRAQFSDGARFEGILEAPTVEIVGEVVWNGVARVGG